MRSGRLAQDAYFYIICKGLVKVLECLISETAAHSLGPAAMREWRVLDHFRPCIRSTVQGIDDWGLSSRSSSQILQRRTVELLIGWSSGKPLAMIFAAWPPPASGILEVLYF